MFIRPMRADDVGPACRLSRDALDGLHAAGGAGSGSAPAVRDPWMRRWTDRAHHLLRHDPGGCWVADGAAGEAAQGAGELSGVVLSLRRDKLWGLSAYFVRPGLQGQGIGGALLDTALGYSQGCLRGILVSTGDPRAARRYRMAGFSLHPTIRAAGVVDRARVPVIDGVRTGSVGDRDLCDSLDRRLRGAARGEDHPYLAREYTLLACDTLTGSGYCYVDEQGSPVLLAATTRKIAQRLLWACFARSPDGARVRVDYLTAAQEWAVDVALAAGLSLRTEGYLGLRHMRPPEPYLPSAAFL